MNAASCADTVPPLIALGATITLQSTRGSRELKLSDLFVGPYETQARRDELLTGIRFPTPPAHARGTFLKLGRRNALSISRLSVAASLSVGSDGKISAARIVPGAVLPVWRSINEAEELLVGKTPGSSLFDAAGKRVAAIMIEMAGRRWSTEYKEPVMIALVRRALEQCVATNGQMR